MENNNAFVIIEHVIGGLHRVRAVSLTKEGAITARDKVKARYKPGFQELTCKLKIKQFTLDDISDIGRIVE